jgi:ABC-type multidrug transport system fused ATPase/permease subunit
MAEHIVSAQRSFSATTKRFFLPIWEIKRVYIWAILTMSNWFLIDFIIVFFADKIGTFVEQQNIDAIKLYMTLFFIVFLISYIIKYLTRRNGAEALRYELAKNIRKQSFSRFFHMDISETEKIWTGKSIKILSDGVHHFVEAHATIAYLWTELCFKILIIWYVLIKLGAIYIALYLIIFTIIIWATNKIFVEKVSYRRKLKREVWINNNRHFVRMIMSKIDILQNRKVLSEIATYVAWVDRQKILAMTNMKWVFLMFNIPLFVVHAFFGCILIYVYVSLSQGYFSYGTFVVLGIVSGSLWWFMLKVTDWYKNVLDHFVEIDKFREFFDQTPCMKNYDTGELFVYTKWDISLDTIWFSYSKEISTNVFTNFSLQIQWWKKTALVGMSGSGKSTLIKLIAGYIMPDSGRVLVDGQDLSAVSLQSYYAHVGYLTQDPSVFDGTIRENLAYGMDHEPEEGELENSIQLAKCERIYDLPHSLDTEIGERGVKLSGWQRQRLAIAKIFLKNPKIVLLDEPTSSLDSFAEEAVTEAMNNLFLWRTVIIIAHRLQTVKHADDIIVLNAGKVIERGRHVELMTAGGYYARMLELQSGF